MLIIEEKLSENVAVDVDNNFCFLVTMKQEDDKSYVIGLTTEDPEFCKQISDQCQKRVELAYLQPTVCREKTNVTKRPELDAKVKALLVRIYNVN